MKARFTTLDIVAVVAEISQSCIGLRVSNVYDINNKTYLIRLSKPDHKVTLLFESGIRLHITDFDWPKNITPSGFSMKLRKHIKNKRLEQIQLVGIDRIVRLQFGTGEWTFHLIVELYDKGNALLTDHQFTIVHLLRPRTDAADQTKIVTSETYQLDKARQACDWSLAAIAPVCYAAATQKGQLARSLTGLFPYGGPLLDHCLRVASGQSLKSLESQLTPDSVEAAAAAALAAFELGETIVASLRDRPDDSVRACVTTKPREVSSVATGSAASGTAPAAASVDPYSGLDFLEFHPMELVQTEGKDKIRFHSFNKVGWSAPCSDSYAMPHTPIPS
uniref:Nuclear export mediator factor NEMF n=1 Tax=Macrostomum lignano TaxID=282301 RepID=A0A1I8IR07_9PLAT